MVREEGAECLCLGAESLLVSGVCVVLVMVMVIVVHMKLIGDRDVGFLRYWTVSNIPLFVLAAPILGIMATSAVWGLTRRSGATVLESGNEKNKDDGNSEDEQSQQQQQARRVVLRLAIPQLVLAVMALTSYHVQIITRLSSGYPVWYWWLASMMSENREIVVFGKKWQLARVISRWMMVYAIVQGGLFVSFLPPA